MSRPKVYELKEFKVGRKKCKGWTVKFDPGPLKDNNFSQDIAWGKCVKFEQEHGGLSTSNNKLAENQYTQCPNCRKIFDRTIEETNRFEEVRRLV